MRRVQEQNKLLSNLSRVNPYFLLQYTNLELLDKLKCKNILELNRLFKRSNTTINYQQQLLLDNYKPDTITADILINNLKLNNTSRSILNYIAKKEYGISFLSDKEYRLLDLDEDIEYLLEKQPYPLINMTYQEIADFLGVMKHDIPAILKKYNWSVDNEYLKIFEEYSPLNYSIIEISDFIGVHASTIASKIKKYNIPRKITNYMKKNRKSAISRYGVSIKSELTDLEKITIFNNILLTKGKVSYKELKTKYGINTLSRVFYRYKNRNIHIVGYRYDKSKAIYYKKDKMDV